MAVTVATYTGQPATTHAVGLPSAPAGTRMLLFAVSGALSSGDPSGWTQVNNSINDEALYYWTRVTDGSEASTVSVGLSASRALAAACIADTGLGSGDANETGALAVSGTAVTAVPITTGSGARAYAAAARAEASVSPMSGVWGSGWTEVADLALDATSDEDPWLSVAYATPGSAGAQSPSLTTARTLPLSRGRGISVSYAYTAPPVPVPEAGWAWSLGLRIG